MPVALFVIADAIQGCCQGPFRAMGRQKLLALFTFVSIWLFGFPLGLYLNFYGKPRLGLKGLWYGLAGGAGLSAAIQILTLCLTHWENESKLLDNQLTSMREKEKINVSLTSPWMVGSRIMRGFVPIDEEEEAEDVDVDTNDQDYVDDSDDSATIEMSTLRREKYNQD